MNNCLYLFANIVTIVNFMENAGVTKIKYKSQKIEKQIVDLCLVTLI